MDLIPILTARTAGTGPGLYKKQMCALTFQLHSGCDTYYWKEKKKCVFVQKNKSVAKKHLITYKCGVQNCMPNKGFLV